jgi:RNA polymerase sigma factor (sigma-70 family)
MSEGRTTSPADAARWVDEHGDALYRYALGRVGRADVAEDLVQETFLAALRAAGSFAGRSSERTWLTGILKNKLIDRLRREGRSRPATEAVGEEVEQRPVAPADAVDVVGPVDQQPAPDHHRQHRHVDPVHPADGAGVFLLQAKHEAASLGRAGHLQAGAAGLADDAPSPDGAGDSTAVRNPRRNETREMPGHRH